MHRCEPNNISRLCFVAPPLNSLSFLFRLYAILVFGYPLHCFSLPSFSIATAIYLPVIFKLSQRTDFISTPIDSIQLYSTLLIEYDERKEKVLLEHYLLTQIFMTFRTAQSIILRYDISHF
jgi:hypothetical protein